MTKNLKLLPSINNPNEREWIELVGKYMINMGSIETITRKIIQVLNGTDQVPIYREKFSLRLSYLRSRYPRTSRHSEIMKIFSNLEKHSNFRNAVAHSAVISYGEGQNTPKVLGLLNLTPKSKNKFGEIININEMKGRVDESSQLGKLLIDIQNDFTLEKTNK